MGLQGIGGHSFIREKLPKLRRLARDGPRQHLQELRSNKSCRARTGTVSRRGKVSAALNCTSISCPNIKEGGIAFGCSLHGTFDITSVPWRRPSFSSGHPKADTERHRCRVISSTPPITPAPIRGLPVDAFPAPWQSTSRHTIRSSRTSISSLSGAAITQVRRQGCV